MNTNIINAIAQGLRHVAETPDAAVAIAEDTYEFGRFRNQVTHVPAEPTVPQIVIDLRPISAPTHRRPLTHV